MNVCSMAKNSWLVAETRSGIYVRLNRNYVRLSRTSSGVLIGCEVRRVCFKRMLECREEPGGSSIPQGVESVAAPKGSSIILSGSSNTSEESIGSELSDCSSQIVVECSTRWFAGRETQIALSPRKRRLPVSLSRAIPIEWLGL